ncbi:hypothetical protein D1007_16506 [Hordeum vulgare]|nr:hypothetical protein D1007_16506 [Hordeum vulgare]
MFASSPRCMRPLDLHAGSPASLAPPPPCRVAAANRRQQLVGAPLDEPNAGHGHPSRQPLSPASVGCVPPHPPVAVSAPPLLDSPSPRHRWRSPAPRRHSLPCLKRDKEELPRSPVP